VSDDAMTLLLRYDWPGNIRELQNALEQALIQDTDRLITPQDLPPSVQRGSMELITSATSGGEEQDQATLVSALRHHRGNRSEAAASLGISRTTLWRRLRQLNSTPT
jgi:transcriptional regulator of acetoin/glycerol metabolism